MAPYSKVYATVKQLSRPAPKSVSSPNVPADFVIVRLIGCSRFSGVLHIQNWQLEEILASGR